MARRTKKQIADDRLIKKLVGNALYRNPINIFDISKVTMAARNLVAEGVPEETAQKSLTDYVVLNLVKKTA